MNRFGKLITTLLLVLRGALSSAFHTDTDAGATGPGYWDPAMS